MKFRRVPVALGAALLLTAASIGADQTPPPVKPATLFPGLGHHHHPIKTRNPDAQKFFDQGLTLVYGFNHDEAIRSFRRAAELDPDAAMPLWGIALRARTRTSISTSTPSARRRPSRPPRRR